jgi:hypothetical protein
MRRSTPTPIGDKSDRGYTLHSFKVIRNKVWDRRLTCGTPISSAKAMKNQSPSEEISSWRAFYTILLEKRTYVAVTDQSYTRVYKLDISAVKGLCRSGILLIS